MQRLALACPGDPVGKTAQGRAIRFTHAGGLRQRRTHGNKTRWGSGGRTVAAR